MSVLSPELIPIHERLVNIRRQLVALAAKETAREVELAEETAAIGKGKAVAKDEDATHSDPNSRTPTRESTPKPPGERDYYRENTKDKERLRVKAELKPIQEELRNIDSLSAIRFPLYSRS